MYQVPSWSQLVWYASLAAASGALRATLPKSTQPGKQHSAKAQPLRGQAELKTRTAGGGCWPSTIRITGEGRGGDADDRCLTDITRRKPEGKQQPDCQHEMSMEKTYMASHKAMGRANGGEEKVPQEEKRGNLKKRWSCTRWRWRTG